MFKRDYRHLNVIEVSSTALIYNLKQLQQKFGVSIAPVLKSNAYGHGLVLVAKILDDQKCPFICVDSLFEAYELLKAGIKTKILIMGYVHPDSLKVKRLPFSFAAFSLDMVETIKKYQPQAGIHLFVDTGMHREGMTLGQVPDGLKVEGLMTHLATYKNKMQLANFKEFQKKVTAKYIHPGNVWRIGLELYKEALMFKATVTQIKTLEKGDKVGYDFTFIAPKKMRMAILSAGYNDGVDRSLSNKGAVIIRGVSCPIIGRVSMNITTVDVSKVPKIKVGDMATIFPNKANKLFPYERLIHLNPFTKRVIV